MVHPEGFEPPTKWFEATYSIQLSYGCTEEECSLTYLKLISSLKLSIVLNIEAYFQLHSTHRHPEEILFPQ